MKSSRAIIVAESDLHGGHSLGLLNPETKLLNKEKKEYSPILTEMQNHLWETREWGRNEIISLADKSPIVLFQIGDVNQGMKYDVDNNLVSQVKIAVMNIHPWLMVKNLVAVRIDAGTEAHSFGYGDAEELLVYNVQQIRKNIDIQLVEHNVSNIYGLLIDHAHHGPNPGKREWTKGNVALYYLRDLMMRDILRGRTPPQLVWRGHYHQVVEVFNRINGPDNKVYKSWLWVLPSLCGMNGFALQRTQSEFELTNGIVAFEVVDGKVKDAYEFTKMLDLRGREIIL